MLPFTVRFAVHTDLALNAFAAIHGSGHAIIGASHIDQFGILVAAGIILHELTTAVAKATKSMRHRWRHRKSITS